MNDTWLCPDLSLHWVLLQDPDGQCVWLRGKQVAVRHALTATEGYALRYFVGRFTIRLVQQMCRQEFSDLPDGFMADLLHKLVDLGILSVGDSAEEPSSAEDAETVAPLRPTTGPRLKASVHWIQTNDGHWILRNPEDVTFVQLNDVGKQIVEQLETEAPVAIASRYGVSIEEMRSLLQQLALTGMLEGTTPPKPPRKKFTPMQVLFFKLSLWNPDSFLADHIDRLRWIWTKTSWMLLCIALAGTGAIALHQRGNLLWTAQMFLTHLDMGTTITFGLLALAVVTLHELGHAFTLKHYGGIVPEMGFMFMFLMPVAYTNTTDQYSLPKRSQRMLVVGAGVLCQLIIATFAFWLWNSLAVGSWLWRMSFLLFAASVFTVAVNLNPLAKFDGYYLAVAATGINNLRQRSLQFYGDLLTGKPSQEQGGDRWILAVYAPFSFVYVLSVFGFLFLNVANWTLTYLPITSLVLLAIWGTYFYLAPDPKN
ncbi:MAG: hypothetical protein EA367_19385 [Leptolyngbya sp. DLM2.Bin15]|nr:MAG: hypothetical protein EA367_19385 [Leptolyngbya sp. DLM2.Bin15]